MEAILEKTSKRDQKIAKAQAAKVTEASSEIFHSTSNIVSLQIEGYKQQLEIPRSAILLFLKIMDRMAAGDSFALLLANNEEDISTQQAADILGVSRPHVVSLLEKGEIPFHKVGTHRRIQMKDLIKYDQKIKKSRADKLDFLAAQAQELNLGY